MGIFVLSPPISNYLHDKVFVSALQIFIMFTIRTTFCEHLPCYCRTSPYLAKLLTEHGPYKANCKNIHAVVLKRHDDVGSVIVLLKSSTDFQHVQVGGELPLSLSRKGGGHMQQFMATKHDTHRSQVHKATGLVGYILWTLCSF